jgi:hypothetical protein
MKIAMNLQRLTFVLAVLVGISTGGFIISPSEALAFDNYKEFKRDHLDFQIGGNYFYSNSNYIDMGTGTTSLPTDNHFKLIDANLETRYIANDMSYFAMGTFSSAESKDAVLTRSNGSLSQVLLGVDFVMFDHILQVIPELSVLIPFNTVTASADKVLNSEGVYQVTTRVNIQKELGRFRAYSWIGFNYRSDDRSYLLPWGVGLTANLKSFKFGGEIFGSQSVTNDKASDFFSKSGRQATVTAIDAGSYLFYYPNPTVVDSSIYAAWKMTPSFQVQVNGGMTLAGENTAAGYHVGTMIRYSFDLNELAQPIEKLEPVHNEAPAGKSSLHIQSNDSELSSEKKVTRFREETNDGVNQGLFKAQPTKKTKAVDDDLQKQMDSTELQIEMKKKTK